MGIPGSNLLNQAFRLIAPTSILYSKFTGRKLDSQRRWVNEHADPVPLTASVQAVPRSAYKTNGFDFQKDYIAIWASLELIDLARDYSGDKFYWNSREWQLIGTVPWKAIDGWASANAVDVGAAPTNIVVKTSGHPMIKKGRYVDIVTGQIPGSSGGTVPAPSTPADQSLIAGVDIEVLHGAGQNIAKVVTAGTVYSTDISAGDAIVISLGVLPPTLKQDPSLHIDMTNAPGMYIDPMGGGLFVDPSVASGDYTILFLLTGLNNNYIGELRIAYTAKAVVPKLVFDKDLQSLTAAKPGDSVDIKVEVSGGVPPYKYAWYHNGELTHLVAPDIGFSSVKPDQAGERYCIVTDANGTSITSNTNLLEVDGINLLLDLQDLQVQEGVDVSFEITPADGKVPYTIKWFKDGVEIPGETSDVLQLPDVKQAAAGIYHAVVTDADGWYITSKKAQLAVTV